MTLIRQCALGILGLCSGVAVAAGVFAFITMLGIVPRMADRTNTAKHIYLYENAIILGGALGNIWYLFEISLPLTAIYLGVFGLFSGIFVGCLAMALAETLRLLPIMINRLQIQQGFPLVVLGIALGKMTGTLFQYFF